MRIKGFIFMNKVIIAGVSFLAGLGIGHTATRLYLATKMDAKYSQIADREIESMREYYEERLKDIESKVESLDYAEEEVPEEVNDNFDVKDFVGKSTVKVDYSKYAEKYDDETNRHINLYLEGEEETEEYQRVKGKPPVEIIGKDWGDPDIGFKTEELIYYAEDNVLATEDGEIIEDWDDIVGDWFKSSDFMKNRFADSLYIRNFDYRIDYEIVKSPGSYRYVYGDELEDR